MQPVAVPANAWLLVILFVVLIAAYLLLRVLTHRHGDGHDEHDEEDEQGKRPGDREGEPPEWGPFGEPPKIQ